jgi:hypothetical protein
MSDPAPAPDPDPAPRPREASDGGTVPRTALPSVGARVLAFAAIVLAGAAGGFIGYAFADLQTDSTMAVGLSALAGAAMAAGGTAVVVVLTLRAMSEWRTIQAVSPPQGGRVPDGGNRRPPRVR